MAISSPVSLTPSSVGSLSGAAGTTVAPSSTVVGATTPALASVGTPAVPTAAPEVGGLTGASGTNLGTPGSTVAMTSTSAAIAGTEMTGSGSAATAPTTATAGMTAATAPSATAAATTPTEATTLSSPASAGTTTPITGTATSSPATSATAPSQTFDATLTPLNGSNVHGTVVVSLAAPSITVDISATGLETGQSHMQTLDGMANGGQTSVPTSANDTDHDGFIEQAEAAQTVGQPILDLSTNPQAIATGQSSAMPTFPQPDATGALTYHEVFTFDTSQPQSAALFVGVLAHLATGAVVLDGMTVPPGPGAGTPGEVNGTNGFLAQLPVAVGVLHDAPAGETPMLG